MSQTVADLADGLTGGTSAPSMSGWRTGSTSGGPLASERDPINLRLLDAQRQAPPVLRAWALWVAEHRDPGHRIGDPRSDRKLLARHLDWITTQPEVTEFWCQLRALWSTLRGHLPVRQCECVDPVTGDHGPIWSDRGGGWCSWCGTAWTMRDLLDRPRPKAAA